MTNKKKSTLRLLAAAFGLTLAAQAQAAGELLISQQLLPDGAVEISYTPPAGQRELTFFDARPDAHKRWRGAAMKAVGPCTELTESGVRLRESPDCRTATLRLEARVLALDAVYEPAQPLSDGSGVLAYSGHVAVLLKGQGLRWRWLPPQGGILIHQGRVFRAPVEQQATAEQVDRALAGAPFELTRDIGAAQYVYLGSAKGLVAMDGGNLLLDPGLDAARVERIRKVLKHTLERLSQLYGVALPGPGAVVTAVSDKIGFHGDTTAGRMMRLRLPVNVDTMPGTVLERFVTHEVVHWWNSSLFATDQQRPWLHEGHAEWMARLLLREQGLMDDAELRADIESNLNNCAMTRREQVAARMAPGRRGDDVYACGMSLMLLGQAQRGLVDRKAAPLAQMAPLHSLNRTLDVNAFVSWADAGYTGLTMTQLLQDAQQPFASGLMARLQAGGLANAEALTSSAQLPLGMRMQTAAALMSALMSADCGKVDFGMRPDSIPLDAQLRCASLRAGDEVTALAGQRLPADPIAAFAAVASACQQGQAIKVSYLNGAETAMACPKVLPPLPVSQLIRLRPDALQRLGLAS